MKFDIPINFSVEATSEEQAEGVVTNLLNKGIKRYGLGELVDYEFFEFIAKESCNDGCGNVHSEQGKPAHKAESSCNCPSKGCC